MFTVEHITKSPYTRKVQDSYAVVLDAASVDFAKLDTDDLGRVVATAHSVGEQWSIKVNGKWAGLAKSREAAVTHLERVAAVANHIA